MRRSTCLWAVLLWLSWLSPADAQKRATRLMSLKLLPVEGGLLAVVEGDGPLEHRVSDEQNPGHQLILDVLGVANPLRHYYPPETHPLLERILMYEYPEATNPARTGPLSRIVFELKRDVRHSITSKGNSLEVLFTDAEPNAPTPTPLAAALEEPSTTPEIDGVEGAETSTNPPDVVVEDPLIPSKVSIEPADVSPNLFFHPAEGGDDVYRLGPEDVLEVRVFELDQLNRTVRVSGDGRIELPLVGSLQARGLTTEQVSREIADRLRDRYVQNPQVSIFVTEFKSQKVSLLGAVSNPSSYPLVGQRRLLQLLAEAGSLAPEAGRTLYVFRQTADGRSARLTVPLGELLLQGDPRWNIVLRPGDVITVPPEQAIAVSILGAVNEPGVHKLPVGDEATLLKAIALAGGLNDRASKKGVQIKRRNEDGSEVVLKANIGDILSGKEPDVVLLEGDVVVVRESFF